MNVIVGRFLAGAMVAGAGTGQLLGQQYVVTELGTLGGATSQGMALNNNGRVAGNSALSNNQANAFWWDRGLMSRPTGFGATARSAMGINLAGRLVGDADIQSFSFPPVVSHYGYVCDTSAAQPGMSIPPLLAGAMRSSCRDINDSGAIVGHCVLANGAAHATLWRGNPLAAMDLGTLGGTNSYGVAISGNGHVVGYSQNLLGIDRAFLFQDLNNNGVVDANERYELTPPLGYSRSYALDVDLSGRVVGSVVTAAGVTRAFRFQDLNNNRVADANEWTVFNAPVALPGSPFWSESINAGGVIVGTGTDAAGNRRALRIQNNAVENLNNLIPAGSGIVLESALDINDRGQITGFGTANGVQRAFLLTPVPTYDVIELPIPAPPSFADFRPLALNQAGQVVGSHYVCDWATTGALTDLGATAQAVAINDAGTVLGNDGNAFQFVDANQNDIVDAGERTWLPTQNGQPTAVVGANRLGQAVGVYGPLNQRPRVPLELDDFSGVLFTDIHNNPTYPMTLGLGINERGQVSGSLVTSTFGQIPAYWDSAGGWAAMPVPFNPQNPFGNQLVGQARDINNARVMVGDEFRPMSSSARIWRFQNGGWGGTTIGNSNGWAINDLGMAVGRSSGAGFVWFNEQLLDLNTMLPAGTNWTILNAFDINDRCEIAGLGQRVGNPGWSFVILRPR